MAESPRRIFIAGSTGATGKVAVRLAEEMGLDIVPHVRPKTAMKGGVHPKAAVCELSDPAALANAMRGCTTVLQLIGTMRSRFERGDTYETSDIGTTRRLVDAAKRVGVDHFVLLGSVGAGRPVGAYLKAKAEAESIVVESGIPYTIFRPSSFEGGGHKPPPGAGWFTKIPGLTRFRPITLDQLARTLLLVARRRAPLGVALEDRALWRVVESAARG